MKIFKTIFICLILCCSTCTAFSQVQKFKATSFASRSLNSNQNWSSWSEFKSVNILVVFDLNTDRITIYSQKEQEYDLISSSDSHTDFEGDDFADFSAINEDGLRCIVTIATIHSRGGFQQLYVKFNDFQWVYVIEEY